MKFMVRWRVHDNKRHDALKTFSQMTVKDDQTDMGEKSQAHWTLARPRGVHRCGDCRIG